MNSLLLGPSECWAAGLFSCEANTPRGTLPHDHQENTISDLETKTSGTEVNSRALQSMTAVFQCQADQIMLYSLTSPVMGFVDWATLRTLWLPTLLV